MTEQMPVVTEEQRQALIARIADLKEEQLSHWTGNYPGSELDRQIWQIALAALTAEPVGYIHKIAWREYKQAVCSGDDEMLEAYSGSTKHFAVYTAPPVPVLKPVVLPSRFSPAISPIIKGGTPLPSMRLHPEGGWVAGPKSGHCRAS